MKIKFVALSAAAVMCMSLAACADKDSHEITTSESVVSTVDATTTSATTEETTTETTTEATKPTIDINELVDKIAESNSKCRQYHANTSMKIRYDVNINVENGDSVKNWLEVSTDVDTYVNEKYRHSAVDLNYVDDNHIDPVVEHREAYYVAESNMMYINVQDNDTWYEKSATPEDLEEVSYDFAKFFEDKSHFENATVEMNSDESYTITVPIDNTEALSSVIAADSVGFDLTADLVIEIDKHFCVTEFRLANVEVNTEDIINELYSQWSTELNVDNTDSSKLEINPNIEADATFELTTKIDSWNAIADKDVKIADDIITNSVKYPVEGTAALGDTVTATTTTESAVDN